MIHALILIALVPAGDDDGPLGLADLAAYRLAIAGEKEQGPAQPAAFRDLWDRPSEYRGRRVAVGGRVERVFHQGGVGLFPPLVEAWVVDRAGDPTCLVFPESSEPGGPRPGDLVAFEGISLRRVRYRGGDVDRLAPLVVGPRRPRVDRAEGAASTTAPSISSPFDGTIVAVLGGIVVLGLLRAHLRAPSPRRIDLPGPPPEFVDGPPGGYRGGVDP